MDYLAFDLVAVAAPAAVLLHRRSLPARAAAAAAGLAALALAWTAPWDDHLVRAGVWSSGADRVVGRLGAVPVEEYLFVVLEVLLVAAWAAQSGALRPAPLPPPGARARRRGALGWAAVAVAGAGLAALGGTVTYLGLLLLWAGPPLALQRLVAGDVLLARRSARLRAVLPVALWLAAVDRLALADGIWAISPARSTGLTLAGLPVEEALFFTLTVLLVADGLLLATDRAVLARVRDRLRAVTARTPAGLVAATEPGGARTVEA